LTQEVERQQELPVEQNPGRLFYTSGTTGHAKSFYLTDEQLAQRVERRGLKPGLAGVKSLLCLLNPRSTAGHTYQLWCVKHNVTFLSPANGSTPVMQTAAADGVEGLVGNPQQLLRLAAYTGTFRFKWILASGGLVSQMDSKIIRSRLGTTFHASYGASEVGTIAVATAQQLEMVPNCLGVPCKGVVVRIDQNGWLAVKTPTMFSGYVDQEDNTRWFRDGWFYPGDQIKLNGSMMVWTGTKRR
jgi:long-subunit acyl-CoA synthetase (AMP-forming)